MDTSKEYIEMCEKAKEIQKEWKPRWGDLYLGCSLEARAWRLHQGKTKNEEPWCQWMIFIPRQDQLQEMLTELSPKGRFVFLMKWMDESLWCNKRLNCDTSAEIIWLVCIMDRKFNKEWDGKEWIKKD